MRTQRRLSESEREERRERDRERLKQAAELVRHDRQDSDPQLDYAAEELVAACLQEYLRPKGVGVVLEAESSRSTKPR